MTPVTETDRQEAGGDQPPAPRRGTRAYRWAVLEVCARREYEDFVAGIEWLWRRNGWHVSLDMMTEMLAGLTRTAEASSRTADGRIDISHFMIDLPEELKLRMAAQAAQNRRETSGDLAPHEVFRQSMANGDRVYADYEWWKPICQEALRAIEDANGDPAAARPFLVRHVPPEDREVKFLTSALMVHSVLRHDVFPKGTAWIDPYVRGETPQLPASHALNASGKPEDAMPEWMREQKRAADEALAADPQRRKRRRRRGQDPTCTCGFH